MLFPITPPLKQPHNQHQLSPTWSPPCLCLAYDMMFGLFSLAFVTVFGSLLCWRVTAHWNATKKGLTLPKFTSRRVIPILSACWSVFVTGFLFCSGPVSPRDEVVTGFFIAVTNHTHLIIAHRNGLVAQRPVTSLWLSKADICGRCFPFSSGAMPLPLRLI